MNYTINSLDPSQKQVLDSLLGDDQKSDISVVYGPPGTGKSHLIVSLLFELAVRKNKVLFVSQNTEALEVISRMVKKIEKSMKLTSDHLSFLDFCLMLNRSEHRRLKYIKNQRDRIFMKGLYPVRQIKHTVDMENIPYNLSYTHLDKGQNEDLLDDSPLGLDELLANYLRNVNNTNILGSIVKSLSSINARKVFNLLKNYEDKYDNFSENNHPTNCLKFISKNNLEVKIPEVHASVDGISNTTSRINNNNLTLFKSKRETDISNFIQLLIKIGELQKELNMANIQYDSIDIEELSKKLHIAVDEIESIEDVEKMNVSEDLNEELFVKIVKVDILNDSEAIDSTENSASEIIKKIKQIVKKGVSDEQYFGLLFTHALCKSNLEAMNLILEFPGFKDFDDKQLIKLIQELKKWNSQNSFQKHIKKPAAIISSLKNEIKPKDIEEILKYEDELNGLLKVLENSTLTVDMLDKMINGAKKKKSAINPLKDIKNSDYIELLHDLLIMKVNAGFLVEDIDNKTLTEIETECKETIDDISKYRKLIDLNIKSASQKTTNEVIEQINCNIRNRNRAAIFKPIIAEYGKYLKLTSDNENNFVEIAKIALNNLGDGNVAKRIFEHIILPKNDVAIDIENLDCLLSKLTHSLDSGMFSDDFYIIKTDDTIKIWCDRVKTIRNFANIDEFDCFVKQNQFIAELKELMGQDNAEDIDEYLKNDPLTFRDFAEKITTDLVKAKYQSLSPSVRARIPNKEYFKTFQKELKEERRNYFLKGLAKLKLSSEDPAKQLKYDANWKPAISVMEKLRANSEMITDAFPVVIATPKEVSKYLKSKKAMFDYVVFDEASQLLPGQALPSIFRAKKAIIVGDPHQMPPTLSTVFTFDNNSNDYDEDVEENDISILDIAIPIVDSECKYQLKIHYRSEFNILFDPSRKAIYNGGSETAPEVDPIIETTSPNTPPITIKDCLGAIDENNFSEISQKVISRLKENPDATFCLLFTRKDKSGELGFKNYISQNQTANKIIYGLIESGKLLISTVTNCQGIEGDHSIIYFNHYDNPGSMWFFNEKAGAYKRLNVAITRQRKSLDILMADSRGKWLTVCQNYTQPGTSPNRLKSAELMLSLLTNAGQEINEEYLEKLLGPNADDIDSPLTQELYNKLIKHYGDRIGTDIKIWCEVGWNMRIPDAEARDRNRKNVGYRLDIGIYSPKKKRFVLGIEMDGATYHSGFAKEFADQQRQEILEMKGWHIYRIWSTNWLNDTESEFNALIAEIDRLLNADDAEISTIDADIDYETLLTETDEKTKPIRSEDGQLDRGALLKYLKQNELSGTPINIKYLKPDISKDQAIFRKMYIESLDDEYMFASFNEYDNKSYKYSIDRIIDYK